MHIFSFTRNPFFLHACLTAAGHYVIELQGQFQAFGISLHPQDQSPSRDMDVKWSPVAALIKIKPPKIPAGIIIS